MLPPCRHGLCAFKNQPLPYLSVHFAHFRFLIFWKFKKRMPFCNLFIECPSCNSEWKKMHHQLGTLSSFSTRTLMVRGHEDHPTCKKYSHSHSQVFTSRNLPNLEKLEKIGGLNKNRACGRNFVWRLGTILASSFLGHQLREQKMLRIHCVTELWLL